MAIPDELVEKIVAMIPFPSIFKARGLSKSWLARFSSIGSLDDEMEKRLASSFQKQGCERPITWGPFCPVSFSKEFSCAYDWASKKWVKLPSLSFLPELWAAFVPKICINGRALLLIEQSRAISYVANIFTKSWKMLPPPINSEGCYHFIDSILVSSTLSETYTVIQFYTESNDSVCWLYDSCHWSAQIYDSKLENWISKKLFEGVRIYARPAYLNGVLYMVTSPKSCLSDLRNLLALNLENRTSEELKLPSSGGIGMWNVNLVVCDGKLLMIVNDSWSSLEPLRVLRVDLELLQLEVTRSPPAALNPNSFDTHRPPVSHGDCLYFGMQVFGKSMLVYNVNKNEWTVSHFSVSLPPDLIRQTEDRLRAVSFQPGQDPFLSV